MKSVRNLNYRGLLGLWLVLFVPIGCTTTPKLSQNTAEAAASSSCPVTLPNGSQNPDDPPSCPGGVYPGGGFRGNHGNGKLSTVLPTNGKFLIAPEEDGSLHVKFPWGRAVCGRLTITGRRLDAPAGPLKAHIPEGYGGAGFQASSVYFPSEGCWEITGRAGN